MYFNGIEEPPSDSENRLVLFQVFDAVFSSNILTAEISFTLVDDNPLLLNCGAGVVGFVEGAEFPVSLTSSLTLSDLDSDHVISSASVAIGNPQEGDEISVNSSLTSAISIQDNSNRIVLSGDAMDTDYQVHELEKG